DRIGESRAVAAARRWIEADVPKTRARPELARAPQVRLVAEACLQQRHLKTNVGVRRFGAEAVEDVIRANTQFPSQRYPVVLDELIAIDEAKPPPVRSTGRRAQPDVVVIRE